MVFDTVPPFCYSNAMATKKSTEIVDEESDYQRRFEKLEERAEKSEGLLEKIAEKLLGTTPQPPEKKDEKQPPAKPTGIKGVLPFLFESKE